ncbi:MAG: hypothetical protein H0V37_02020 [Chloroflexia bacterium]|nr:hypothetical protein [Chloroflexia bacterium]
MRPLGLTSYGLTLLGVITLVSAFVFDLGATFQVTGLLLSVAGIVKVIVVYLWTHVAHLGNDRHDPIPPA